MNDTQMTQKNSISKQFIKEIAIGSKNPVKIQAVKNALNNGNIQIIPYAAVSKVRSQPLSNEETLQGAINRARDCLENTQSDVAIGLEAGVVFIEDKVYLCHWGAIADRDQNIYFTNGPLVLLPSSFCIALKEEKNLEDIMHYSTGIDNLGAKEGAIGVFTQNRLNREQVLTQIATALVGQYFYYQK